MTITAPPAEVTRDRWGRPMILPPAGGKPVAYTRCTTFVGAYEDTHNLTQWKMRQVAVGLSLRSDLQLSVAAHRDDKQKLNALMGEAMDAAASSSGATTGTALHTLTEHVDRGQELVGIPVEAMADIAAYSVATADLKAVFIEQMTVHDPWKVAGTPDRIVSYRGKRYIADLKTGSIEWGIGKIAAQLAMYARSTVYDVATGERTVHGAEVDRGIIIHLPAGSGVATLHWVDLLAGWNVATCCKHVREMRALKFADLTEPFDAPAAAPEPVAAPAAPSLADLIAECVTDVALRDLWTTHQASWTDAHTELARTRLAQISSHPAA